MSKRPFLSFHWIHRFNTRGLLSAWQFWRFRQTTLSEYGSAFFQLHLGPDMALMVNALVNTVENCHLSMQI